MIRGFLGRKSYYRLALENQRRIKLERHQQLLNAKATLIQSAFRTFQCRNVLNIKRTERRRRDAAVKIEAVCRGHLGRMQTKVRKLEQQLLRIERQRESDLADIQQWKRRQLLEVRKEINAEIEDFIALKAEARCSIRKLDEVYTENVKLRRTNEKLRADIAAIKEANRRCLVEHEEIQNCTQIVTKKMIELNVEREQWQEVSERYEKRLREYESATQNIDDLNRVEQNVVKKYQSSIRNIQQSISISEKAGRRSKIGGDSDGGRDDRRKLLSDQIAKCLIREPVPVQESPRSQPDKNRKSGKKVTFMICSAEEAPEAN